jgi:hypothetical protein
VRAGRELAGVAQALGDRADSDAQVAVAVPTKIVPLAGVSAAASVSLAL